MKSLSRRDLLAGAALSLAQIPAIAHAQPADGAVIAKWMEQWMEDPKTRKVVGRLHMSRFVEPIYFLLKPTVWLPNAGTQDRLPTVTVPSGFVTDFASIPSIFWSKLRPDGNYTHPAIIHDYLYWTQTTTRETADEIFRIAMEDFSISTIDALAIYSAVRVAGGWAWDGNATARGNGEKRILKVFPAETDTTAKWDDWRRRPEVFE